VVKTVSSDAKGDVVPLAGQVLSFGVGLAAPGPYRMYALTGPDRVVLDVSHVALGRFPGIWDITSWQQYWKSQYAWDNGHQPWLSNPAMVVEAWSRSRWHTTPVVRQVGAGTFQVTEPDGRVDTVSGMRPITVPGPWVIRRSPTGRRTTARKESRRRALPGPLRVRPPSPRNTVPCPGRPVTFSERTMRCSAA
jgi:hypothetical protein